MSKRNTRGAWSLGVLGVVVLTALPLVSEAKDTGEEQGRLLEARLPRGETRDFYPGLLSDLGYTIVAIHEPGPDVAANALSGGNQQKLIVGREMMAEPTVLLASHPTRGIDVGAQAAVWEVMKQARRNGLATVLVSADLDELIGLSDTLLVMYGGRIVATLDPATVTPSDLGSYMTGAQETAGDAA